MSLYLHLGPSGSGKTHRLMQIVIDEASASVNRNVLLIVPEQVSMQATAKLVAAHPGHTIMNADVLSFMRLAYRVFDEQGRKVPLVLDDTGKSMIVKKVALDIADKLSVYAVSSADTLARPAWAKKRVRKNKADAAELDQVRADGEDGDVGETTIYITPVGGATSEFFRLEAK